MNTISFKILEKKAAEFRQHYGLSDTEAVKIDSLLLKLNVMTIFWPMSEKFAGMSLKDNENHRFILVNSNHPIGRQHFTIAHELFHLFIEDNPEPHNCEIEGSKNPSEKLADAFASLLLIPESAVFQMIPTSELEKKTISVATIVRLEQYFSVSQMALLNRLTDLAIINKNQRAELMQIHAMEAARRYGHDLSLYQPGNEGRIIGNYGELAQKLFEQEIISEGHLIEIMNKL